MSQPDIVDPVVASWLLKQSHVGGTTQRVCPIEVQTAYSLVTESRKEEELAEMRKRKKWRLDCLKR